MGFAVYYRSTRSVAPTQAEAIERAADDLCRGRTWLECEPIRFYAGQPDGHLFGGSKPNFQPHPDDDVAAAREGLPDGTMRDLLNVLCQLSREHGVDWEISHDHSGGPIGHIRTGVCDPEVLSQINALADLGNILAGELDGLEDEDIPEDEGGYHS